MKLLFDETTIVNMKFSTTRRGCCPVPHCPMEVPRARGDCSALAVSTAPSRTFRPTPPSTRFDTLCEWCGESVWHGGVRCCTGWSVRAERSCTQQALSNYIILIIQTDTCRCSTIYYLLFLPQCTWTRSTSSTVLHCSVLLIV